MSPYQQSTRNNIMRAPCPTGPVVTVENGGRLGNKLFEYGAVWSLSRILKRPAFVPLMILEYLQHVFVNLSVPALESIDHCHLDLGPPLKHFQLHPLSAIQNKYRNRHILLRKWIVLPEPVVHERKHLGEEFRFQPHIIQRVTKTFNEFRRDNVTYIGIHVRRTDFETFLPRMFNTSLTSATYFTDAMAWFRRHIQGDVLFVVVSDDPDWCKRELVDKAKDVVLAAKTGTASAGHDLAVLALCNHTIIDYGTFGIWGALLANGITISLGIHEVDNEFSADPLWHVWKVK